MPGIPAFSSTSTRRGSCATSAAIAVCRSASVWMNEAAGADMPANIGGEPFRTTRIVINGSRRMSTTPVFRFAPSPNGYLHLGHAYSALLNHEMAQAAGGRLLLRIEDIDAERCRPEYEAAIIEDLRWLGFTFEEPVRRQSEHFAEYRAALGRLDAMGLVYPSFESRAEIAALVAARET